MCDLNWWSKNWEKRVVLLVIMTSRYSKCLLNKLYNIPIFGFRKNPDALFSLRSFLWQWKQTNWIVIKGTDFWKLLDWYFLSIFWRLWIVFWKQRGALTNFFFFVLFSYFKGECSEGCLHYFRSGDFTFGHSCRCSTDNTWPLCSLFFRVDFWLSRATSRFKYFPSTSWCQLMDFLSLRRFSRGRQ